MLSEDEYNVEVIYRDPQFIRVAQLPRLSVARQSAVPSTATNRSPNGNQGMQSF